MKETDNKNVDADYEYSRKTYYELIEKSKETLDLMADVARESEHPRAFEVFGNMVKQIADVNDKLMDVNAKLKKVKNEEDIKQIGQTTNNLFVGTTTELQRLIQKEMERRAKFGNLDDNTESSLSQLEKFNIDKSKEN